MDETRLHRDELRRRIKRQRRALSADERTRASQQFVREARRARLIRPNQRIAFYSPVQGEAPVDGLIDLARALRCEVRLPAIVNHRTHRMVFVRCTPHTPMRRHRWGFMEPVSRRPTALRSLGVVFMPAVAVDDDGNRMGAGAGFYDRAFAFRRTSQWRRPRLIAVVYEFQRVAHLNARPWDVPVDAILSESGVRWTRRTAHAGK